MMEIKRTNKQDGVLEHQHILPSPSRLLHFLIMSMDINPSRAPYLLLCVQGYPDNLHKFFPTVLYSYCKILDLLCYFCFQLLLKSQQQDQLKRGGGRKERRYHKCHKSCKYGGNLFKPKAFKRSLKQSCIYHGKLCTSTGLSSSFPLLAEQLL